MLLTGVLASAAWGGTDGLLFGNPRQIAIQAAAIGATIVYSAAMTWGILKALALFAPIRAAAWLATLATVPVLYDGFEIQLEHLIMADVPFLFLLMLAVTLLLWDPGPPAPSLRRCLFIGALLGVAEIVRSVVGMCRELDTLLIAEGIETDQQAELLGLGLGAQAGEARIVLRARPNETTTFDVVTQVTVGHADA